MKNENFWYYKENKYFILADHSKLFALSCMGSGILVIGLAFLNIESVNNFFILKNPYIITLISVVILGMITKLISMYYTKKAYKEYKKA